MKIGELVRCPRCNSENPPEYRFCGMCGTPLDKPAEPSIRGPEPVRTPERTRQPETVPPPPPTSTLSGPSFLGLSQPSRGTEDVTYLFEEEQPKRTYWRFMLLLLILAIVGGLGYLQYSRSGKSWTAPWANQKPTTPEEASQQTPPPAPPAQNPASQQPGANAAATGQPNAAGTPNNPAQPKETDIAPGSTPPAAAPQAQGADNSAAGSSKSEEPPAAADTSKKQSKAPASGSKVAENEAAADQGDTGSDNAADNAEGTPVAKAKSAPAKPAPTPAANPDDALVANAEKYLYGRGVPQNCDRALVSLRAAADRQNARAQSMLGTMYGTGHCVPRDLPNAYRWFALASRQQSDNMYIQRNLEMIWREMTPQERQLAMQSNR